MSKKRIAVIGLKGLPAFGGGALVGESILGHLKDDYEFTVYAISSHTDLKSGDYNGYQQIVFRKFFVSQLNVLYYYLASAFHALFKGYHLVHLHHSTAAFILFILRLRYKVIATSHGLETDNKWKYLKAYIKLQAKILLRFSNIITTVSKVEFEKYKDSQDNIFYVPNGIQSGITVNTPCPVQEDFVLFMAGRIIPLKGCHLFLEALKKIDYSGKLLVVGDLDQMPDYKKEILELSEGLNVDFIGLIKDKDLMYSYLLKAQLFVFPSTFENMSMMLLEAVSLKTAIVCSDIPTNKVIFDEQEMIYFKTENSDDLAEKIRYAMDNEELMKVKAQNAYKRLTKNYLWESIAVKYDLLYKRLLKTN